MVLTALIGAGLYNLWANTIFSCQASEYGQDRYLAYCHGKHYGDYDHGAIWFDLEPDTTRAARTAEVLFLGNSHMQFGFSSPALDQWFAAQDIDYYMLGFSHNESYKFVSPLLDILQPQPAVYIVNISNFFDPYSSQPARSIMSDRRARDEYVSKRRWQYFHRAVCSTFPGICGNKIAFFRYEDTGMWYKTGGNFVGAPASYIDELDTVEIENFTARGIEFFPRLETDSECVILTSVPTRGSIASTHAQIADALDMPFVAPRLDGLATFDGDHLDEPSAARWSKAFLELAAPIINSCIDRA